MRLNDESVKSVDRRNFLRRAGLTTVAGAVFLAGCDKDDDMDPSPSSVDLGSGDTGILNYAYALEQLEAAFYTQVVATPYSGITDAEKTLLTDIRDHEIVHRDFLKAALGGSAIGSLEVNFSSIDFTSRASVLGAAKLFEDTGVAAYNGAGNLLTNGTNLLVAGKIVSVEARHAAAIRDLLSPNSASFAGDDIVNSNGLDNATKPADILAAVKPYVKTTITASNLPTA
ncbi:ferritin-like domain-containing protein [Emticicia sp. BO119]|uniref:ferritin-like domain-containing protein n=1 Tax=Emticicia sp. BO119 TaxID=2757768 RepID=UPI0015EFE7A7|nr:ferritin-like domain-containing protein [Emticicia sp. BO119]MBA4853528.1 ferritin-like domain-containing protein [Emticicia sp. BO119]